MDGQQKILLALYKHINKVTQLLKFPEAHHHKIYKTKKKHKKSNLTISFKFPKLKKLQKSTLLSNIKCMISLFLNTIIFQWATRQNE